MLFVKFSMLFQKDVSLVVSKKTNQHDRHSIIILKVIIPFNKCVLVPVQDFPIINTYNKLQTIFFKPVQKGRIFLLYKKGKYLLTVIPISYHKSYKFQNDLFIL